MADEVRDQPRGASLELMVEGQRAEAYYTLDGKVMNFTHTDVPSAVRPRDRIAVIKARSIRCGHAAWKVKAHAPSSPPISASTRNMTT